MLSWFSAMLLGIIQGVTEWLPVSSSGQTTLVMVNFLGIDAKSAIALGLAVHIGTALAVVARYPTQLLELRKWNPSTKFYWFTTTISLLVAFPLVILLSETFESEFWTGVTITILVGLALIFTGVILGAEKGSEKRRISSGGLGDYLIVGISQGVAVLPGISRSGMTVTALLMKGFKKDHALVFSFLLSVPVSIASAAYFIILGDAIWVDVFYFGVALAFSFLFGYLTMNALVRIAKDMRFSKLCILLGGLAVLVASIFWLLG